MYTSNSNMTSFIGYLNTAVTKFPIYCTWGIANRFYSWVISCFFYRTIVHINIKCLFSFCTYAFFLNTILKNAIYRLWLCTLSWSGDVDSKKWLCNCICLAFYSKCHQIGKDESWFCYEIFLAVGHFCPLIS